MAGPHPFPPADTWNFTQHNPFQAVYETNRRSVYLMTQRTAPAPVPGPVRRRRPQRQHGQRITTTVPTQALFFLNDPFVHEQADRFAARLLQAATDDAGRIDLAHRLVYGRPATPEETRAGEEYLRRYAQGLKAAGVPAEKQGGGMGELLPACCSPPTSSFTSIEEESNHRGTEDTRKKRERRKSWFRENTALEIWLSLVSSLVFSVPLCSILKGV